MTEAAEPYDRARGRGDVPRPPTARNNDEEPRAGSSRDGGQGMRGPVRGRRILEEIVVTNPEKVSKQGTVGREVILKSNYFVVQKRPLWMIHQYRIDFDPDNEVTSIRKGLLRQHRNVLGNGGYLFDGTIFSTSLALPEHLNELTSTRHDGSEVKITIRNTRSLTPDLKPENSDRFQILNLIMRSAMGRLHLQPIGRNYFDPHDKRTIPQHRLELWPGYMNSIRQYEHDILLNSEITYKMLRMKTLLEIFRDCTEQGGNPYENFERIVLGTTVMTSYNNKTYKIHDVDKDQTPESTFPCKDATISFIDYYKTRYGITIRDPKQPLLISNPSARDRRRGMNTPIALIPELCRATGLTDDIRSNQRTMQDLARITRVSPEDRLQRLQRFNQRLLNTPESVEIFREWEMELANDVINFKARVLPAEIMEFGDGATSQNPNADWTGVLHRKHLYRPEAIQNWVVLHSFRQRGEAHAFVENIRRAVVNMNLTIDTPHFECISDENGVSYLRSLDNLLTRREPRCILVILPNANPQLYQIVKKKCCIDRSVPTQVVVYNTIKKQGLSIATKIAIQMTTKLGAVPWMIRMRFSKLMVCGFDITYDTSDKRRNFGALVAALDLQNTNKYFSTVSEFRQGETLSNQLAIDMRKAVVEYSKANGFLPERIILYRGGVGEGQLKQVFEYEVNRVSEVINEGYALAGKEPPKFGFIVASKSLKTRLFKAENNRNPDPGTIVDDHITLPEWLDFYLVSQQVRQGTVSPTCYNVLKNAGWTAERLQLFTWKMCHLYYNWSGTTRVPAVVQYAKKLAFLVGQHLHEYPKLSQNMDKQLYFL